MQSPVPAFSGSLRALSNVLSKAEAHCEAKNIDPDALLTARLYPDMTPASFTSASTLSNPSEVFRAIGGAA